MTTASFEKGAKLPPPSEAAQNSLELNDNNIFLLSSFFINSFFTEV